MVGEPVHAFQPLHIVVDRVRYANIGPEIVFGNLIQCTNIDEITVGILSCLPPSILFHNPEKVSTHGKDIISRNQVLEKQVPVLLRAGTER